MSEVTPISKARKAKKETAIYADYLDLFKQVLGEVKRDIFSGHLVYWCKQRRLWMPVLGKLSMGMVSSVARDSDGFFSASAVEDHVYRCTNDTKAGFLSNIPAWDGEDRIKVIGQCVKCKNFTETQVEELIKDWGAKMYRRLHDPINQNRILVIKGDQGLGKDYLVKQMLGALGQYIVPFTICQQEKDTFDQLTSGLVMTIGEFDRTNRTEVAALKYMITAERVYYRGAYDKVPTWKTIRNSFIATCNIDNILRDETGNRRYIILDVESIDWRYPVGESEQILAQWKHLAHSGADILSKETKERLDGYIKDHTPPGVDRSIIDDFRSMFTTTKANKGMEDGKEYVLSSEFLKEFGELSRNHQRNITHIRALLKQKGYHSKGRDGQRYFGVSTSKEEEAIYDPNDPKNSVTGHVTQPITECDEVTEEQRYVAEELALVFGNDSED